MGTNALTYLHTDHLGSTVLTTGVGGTAKYHAYGALRAGGVQSDYQFTGQEADSGTGLIYMRARYYDPVIGQFISPDTLVPDPTNVYAYNRYMYAYGNPLNYNDPTGHQTRRLTATDGGGYGKAAEVVVGFIAVSYGTDADLASSAPPPITAPQPPAPLRGFATEDAGSSAILDTPLEEGSLVGVEGVRVGPELPSQNIESFPLWPHSIYDNVYFASTLRENLIKSGQVPKEGWQAHHIVALSDPRAAEARAILQQAGIDINDPANGVFLPGNSQTPERGKAAIHSKVHTDAYYDWVFNVLDDAGPDSVLDALDDIRSRLEDGYSPR